MKVSIKEGGKSAADAAARYGEQAASSLQQAEDQYDQLVAQLGGDTLGSKIASIDKKYNQMESSIRKSMIGTKGATADAKAALEQLEKNRALEKLIAESNAWKKAMLGRGAVVQIGSKFTCIVDRPVDTPSGGVLFGVGNILKDTFEIKYLSTEERANCIEVTYKDKDANYSKQTLSWYGQDYNTSPEQTKTTQVTLLGCDNTEQALRHDVFYCLLGDSMATATYISGTSFSISGNMIAEFCVGRAVRCDCGTAGTFTGYITSSSYSSSTGLTTVVVSLDTGSLTNQLSSVSHGNDVPASMCRATQLSVGAVLLATSVISVAGTDAAKPITPATQRQAVLSWVRDSLGKFPGITPPSLNLFCGEATDDTVPIGAFTRSTVGTRRGPTGLIESVAAGSPRREWDASGNLLGWLMQGLMVCCCLCVIKLCCLSV